MVSSEARVLRVIIWVRVRVRVRARVRFRVKARVRIRVWVRVRGYPLRLSTSSCGAACCILQCGLV